MSLRKTRRNPVGLPTPTTVQRLPAVGLRSSWREEIPAPVLARNPVCLRILSVDSQRKNNPLNPVNPFISVPAGYSDFTRCRPTGEAHCQVRALRITQENPDPSGHEFAGAWLTRLSGNVSLTECAGRCRSAIARERRHGPFSALIPVFPGDSPCPTGFRSTAAISCSVPSRPSPSLRDASAPSR